MKSSDEESRNETEEISHKTILELVAKFGYKDDPQGMCLGICGLAQQYFFDEFESFVRMLRIFAKYQTDELIRRVEAEENKRLEYIEEFKLNFFSNLSDENNEDKLTFNNEMKQYELYSEALESELKKYESNLTEENKDLLSVRAFIQSVSVYFASDEYPQLFPDSQVPNSQDISHTFTLLLPPTLMLKETKIENGKLITIEYPKIKKACSFNGVYSYEELINLFTTINNKLQSTISKKVTFLLSSSSHSILLGWCPKKKWSFVDSEQLSILLDENDRCEGNNFELDEHDKKDDIQNCIEPNNNGDEDENCIEPNNNGDEEENCIEPNNNGDEEEIIILAERVLNSLSENENAIFNIEVTSEVSICEEIKMLIEQCLQDEVCVNIYNVDEKMKIFNSSSSYLIHVAAKTGDFKLVTRLIDKGMDINKPDGIGFTPLLLAVQEGYLELASLLINNKADIDRANKNDVTPLSMAVFNKNCNMVNLLIKLGADINHLSKKGESYLYLSSENGETEIIKILLQYGADPNRSIKVSKNMLMNTLIGRQNNNELSNLFIKNNLQENSIINFTPLHAAVFFNHKDSVIALLESEKINIDIETEGGITVFDLAKAMGREDILFLLNLKQFELKKENNDTQIHENTNQNILLNFFDNHNNQTNKNETDGKGIKRKYPF